MKQAALFFSFLFFSSWKQTLLETNKQNKNFLFFETISFLTAFLWAVLETSRRKEERFLKQAALVFERFFFFRSRRGVLLFRNEPFSFLWAVLVVLLVQEEVLFRKETNHFLFLNSTFAFLKQNLVFLLSSFLVVFFSSCPSSNKVLILWAAASGSSALLVLETNPSFLETNKQTFRVFLLLLLETNPSFLETNKQKEEGLPLAACFKNRSSFLLLVSRKEPLLVVSA